MSLLEYTQELKFCGSNKPTDYNVQIELFEETAKAEPNFIIEPNTGIKIYKDYDYYNDNAEAVVYLIMKSGKNTCNCVFVMTRKEAVMFCERDETQGNMWFFAFTTYRVDWRDTIDKDFRKDDGRFNWLLDELGIVPIFRL